MNTRATDKNATEALVLVHGRILLPGRSAGTSATVELFHHHPGIGYSEKLAEAVSDVSGRYSLIAKDHAALALRVTGEFADTYLLIKSGRSGYSGKRALREIEQDVEVAQGHVLTGRVVDAEGAPLAEIPVQLTPSFRRTPAENKADTRPRETWKTTSTAEGTFKFGHIARGVWIVGAKAEALAPLSIPVDIPTSGAVTLQLDAKGGTVHGKVVHKHSGAPLPGVPVQIRAGDMNQLAELEQQHTTTTADGLFHFENLSTGPLRLYAESADQKLWMALPRPAPLHLANGETTDVIISMYAGHAIAGMVYDKDTSEPLSGAVVSTFSQGKEVSAESDESGTYKLENIIPYDGKTANLRVTLDGFAAAIGDSSNYRDWINVALAEDGSPARADFPMEQKISVRGKVVTEDDVPVSNAMVRMHQSSSGEGGPRQVKPDGTFTLFMRPFSDGHIEAEAGGFVKAVLDSVRVTNQPLDGLKIVMRIGATVQGRVTDSSGKPVEGAELQVTHQYGSFGYIHSAEKSGANGDFIITDLPENVELQASKEGYAQSEKATLTLEPGEARSGINLVLRDTLNHTISGTVVTPDGKPVSKTSVSIFPSHGYSSAVTKEDGSFTLDGLPQGTYDLQVSMPRHKVVRSIKTGTKDLKIVIELPVKPKATVPLLGTVVDDITGDVVKDFEVAPLHSTIQIERLTEPGKFRITGISERHIHSLTLSSPNHESQVHNTEAGYDGEIIEQEFRLTTPGGITGRVVMAGSGEAMPNLTVVTDGIISRFRQHSETPVRHTVTDADGKFTLAPVPAGKNGIRILTPAPYAEVKTEVTVKSGEITELGDVEIGGGGTLRGRVVRGKLQEPVVNIEVQIRSVTNDVAFETNLKTDNDGRFEVLGLKDARYDVLSGNVRVSKEVQGTSAVDVVVVLGGTTIKVELPLATVHMMVGSPSVQQRAASKATHGPGITL